MPEESPSTFGPNAWLVDEMYDQYKADPSSVSESWQEFFADYKQGADAPELNNGAAATNGATAVAGNGSAGSATTSATSAGWTAGIGATMTSALVVS